MFSTSRSLRVRLRLSLRVVRKALHFYGYRKTKRRMAQEFFLAIWKFYP